MSWNSDLGNGRYRNPILFCDYSDPDVIRVGDTWYMTASSFNYVPGLPILTSRDLVNWRLRNYAVSSIPYDDYAVPAHGRGIWAPSIRYREGRFYIFYGMPDEGIFFTSTEDPLDEWDVPKLVLEAQGYIDPCPFWDDDGRAYVVHAYAKSRIGFKSRLGLFSMDVETCVCNGPDRILFNGTETQPTIEGPKLYKRDGFYYIFAPAGGVEPGWQTVLRSESLQGPYEERVVLHQGQSQVNGPHQGAWVDAPDGRHWFVHFQDKGVYGRITHLQPLTWNDDGWPSLGVSSESGGAGEPVEEYVMPGESVRSEDDEPRLSDDFEGRDLALQWQWSATPRDDAFSLNARKGYLRLFPHGDGPWKDSRIIHHGEVLTQKVAYPAFTARTVLDAEALAVGEAAGLAMLGFRFATWEIRRDQDGFHLVFDTGHSESLDSLDSELVPLTQDTDFSRIALTVDFQEGGVCRFGASMDDKALASIEGRFRAEEGRWVGARLGLFARRWTDGDSRGWADFENFHVYHTSEGDQ